MRDPHFRDTGRHLPYGITQCYLPPDTSERAPPNPSHAGWYSIYLPWRDGRLSYLDSAPAGSRTSDLSVTSPTPNRCTTKTTKLTCVGEVLKATTTQLNCQCFQSVDDTNYLNCGSILK